MSSDEVIPETVSDVDAICISDNVDNDSVSGDNTRDLNSNVSIRNEKRFLVGQRVRGIHKDSGEIINGTIHSRAGKSTGKFKSCYNIKKNDDCVSCYDIEKDFSELDILPDNNEMLVLYNSDDVSNAKEQEINNWMRNDVYEEVENIGQSVISLRWVITEKIKDKTVITKARLVARGFEEDTADLRKDSPTCSKEAVRLTLALASTKGWQCHSLDVKAAYLQGNAIDREIFVRPPPEYFTGKIWKLKKTVYGLCDAARAWYMRVKHELVQLGVKLSSYDSALFTWKYEGQVEGVVCVYVDDLLWAGTCKFENMVIQKLTNLFLIGSSDTGSFKYIGLNLKNTEKQGITIDQFDYASSLAHISVSCERSAKKSSALSENEKVEYRSLIGQLNWIGTQTRPDILFDVCELSVNFKMLS